MTRSQQSRRDVDNLTVTLPRFEKPEHHGKISAILARSLQSWRDLTYLGEM